MWFFQNPEIIFYHFFHILNLDIFWVLILQKCIGSRYLVPLTPPTVFGRSFWNFTWAFRMAWRYACVFFLILKIFYHFFRIFNLDIFWVLILQKHIESRYLAPVTPTTVLSRSFWNFTGAFRMVWRYACGFFESWNYFLSLFTHFELRHFLSSNITEVYREQVPCPLNSSHSFWPILLKLYMGFKDGLKICMWIFQNPEIIFLSLFPHFNLDIFWVLILQKCIGSRYLVPLTPPTVFGWSFWNFTWAFRMAWRYACGFFESWNYFLSLFTHFELKTFFEF